MVLEKQAILDGFYGSVDFTKSNPMTAWEEDNQIEFKKSLQTSSQIINKDYLKTISGFANNIGGVLIFGIDPDNKELVGIKDEYENLDNRYVSVPVRDSLDGQVDFLFFTQRYIGKLIGFLLVQEASSKPIIFKVNAGTSNMGEIYFRYSAVTGRIGAGELRKILLTEITNKITKTIETFQKIVELGNENIAILNTRTGEIQSSEDNLKLYLSEGILHKLNLIKEGKLVDDEGAPAYIIKGQIEVDQEKTIKEKHVPYVITQKAIFDTFFSNKCDHPETMLDQVLRETTQYLPIHFFISLMDKSSLEALEYIRNTEKEVNENTRNKVIERLGEYKYGSIGKILNDLEDPIDDSLSLRENIQSIVESRGINLNINKEMQVKRTMIYNSLRNIRLLSDNYYSGDLLKLTLEAFTNLTKNQIMQEPGYFVEQLRRANNVKKQSNASQTFRICACILDDYLFKK
ncbi:AlbA family DNA-binding domain-containing protein [Xanthocytophaga flava]|uniref:AlbA family DNA-binding domain-containing protein n=1 Tax=Xanthocytophaga flava TaxID=3048013 RepID=UPI0028D0030E|nr:ATP-binding protein [Xanthocytophaga flavus]MDJ1466967.1 ATP-binding protein [Xanthocytophaga flavus]